MYDFSLDSALMRSSVPVNFSIVPELISYFNILYMTKVYGLFLWYWIRWEYITLRSKERGTMLAELVGLMWFVPSTHSIWRNREKQVSNHQVSQSYLRKRHAFSNRWRTMFLTNFQLHILTMNSKMKGLNQEIDKSSKFDKISLLRLSSVSIGLGNFANTWTDSEINESVQPFYRSIQFQSSTSGFILWLIVNFMNWMA